MYNRVVLYVVKFPYQAEEDGQQYTYQGQVVLMNRDRQCVEATKNLYKVCTVIVLLCHRHTRDSFCSTVFLSCLQTDDNHVLQCTNFQYLYVSA